mmetsp:Transcript_44081/g.70458  ORF Transcript_44081/g.70458 Transcript_44081/m.70458 type:complete len:229 (+) Transcript_44081:647-1333(+)
MVNLHYPSFYLRNTAGIFRLMNFFFSQRSFNNIIVILKHWLVLDYLSFYPGSFSNDLRSNHANFTRTRRLLSCMVLHFLQLHLFVVVFICYDISVNCLDNIVVTFKLDLRSHVAFLNLRNRSRILHHISGGYLDDFFIFRVRSCINRQVFVCCNLCFSEFRNTLPSIHNLRSSLRQRFRWQHLVLAAVCNYFRLRDSHNIFLTIILYDWHAHMRVDGGLAHQKRALRH